MAMYLTMCGGPWGRLCTGDETPLPHPQWWAEACMGPAWWCMTACCSALRGRDDWRLSKGEEAKAMGDEAWPWPKRDGDSAGGTRSCTQRKPRLTCRREGVA